VGGRFWIWLMAVTAGIAIAVGIGFLIIGAAVAAWGVLGGLVVLVGVLLGIAWFYDRRQQARYD
jgi:hypothetical protein